MSSSSVLRKRKFSGTDKILTDAHHPKKMNRRTLINLLIVYFSVFLDTMGMSVVQPIMPFYAESFNASSLQLGFLYSSYALMSSLATLVMGQISDKYGRRKVIIFSLFGTMIGFLMHGFAQNYYELLAYRFLTGAFGGTFPIAQAYVTDVVPAAQRPTYLAAAGGTLSIAFIIGPGMGSGLAEFGLRVPFFVSAGMGLFGVIFAYFALQESHPKFIKKQSKLISVNDNENAGIENLNPESEKEEKENETEKNDIEKKSSVPIAVWIICCVYFCASGAWAAYTSMYGLYIIAVFHLTSLESGFITLCLAVVIICGTIFIFNILAKKIGVYFACVIGFCIFTIALTFSTFPNNVWLHLSIVVFGFGSGFGTIMPAMSSMAADFTNAQNRGKILGYVAVSSNLAFVIAPIIHGILFDINVRYPFFAAAVFSMFGLIIMLILIIKYPNISGLAKLMNKEPDLPAYDEDDVCVIIGPVNEHLHRLQVAETWEFVPDTVTEADYERLGHAFGDILNEGNYKWVEYFEEIKITLRKLFPVLSVDNYMLHMEDIDEVIRHADIMAGDKEELDRIRAIGNINF